MKNIIQVAIAILFSLAFYAQDTNQNFSKVITYKKQSTLATIDSNNPSDANVQVTYYDGLGRPVQQIAHKQSNSGNDIVTHIEYDQYGRKTKDYLPYVRTSPSLAFSTSAQTDLLNFYSSPSIYSTGSDNFEATLFPFSEKELEDSPLNRVHKQAAPGEPWVLPLTSGSTQDKSIKFIYHTNEFQEVKQFKVNASWVPERGIYQPLIVEIGFYEKNLLYKTIVKDENWKISDLKNNTTEEFKDLEGKVILKKTYSDYVDSNGNTIYQVPHETYYLYDQFNNLTYVLPPLANGATNHLVLNSLCYQYKYDSRNRLVEKKLPGKQWEFIVYNNQNFPVAVGPVYNPWEASNESDSGWLITKYDAFSRVVYTGYYTGKVVNEDTRHEYQQIYDPLSFFEVIFTANPIDNIVVGYSNKVFPISNYKLLTINYYDSYGFPYMINPIPAQVEGEDVFTNVKSMSVASWARILDNPANNIGNVSYTFYDKKYRPIRNYSTNNLGGFTQVDLKLDWSGKTIYTLTKHKRTSSDSEIVVKDMFEYTDQDRLKLHKQQITSSSSMPEQLIAKNTYDELGQLISKNVGGTDVTGSLGLQKVDYSYNIRGWLKQINNTDDLELENDLFAFKINYDTPSTANPLFNGNISETLWKTSSDNKLRKYDYSYDHLNRLLKADYSKQGSTVFNSYLEEISYDKNGNIQSLLRNGGIDTDGYQSEHIIDDLTYLYDTNNKNQLLRVFDGSGSPDGFKDDTDGTNIYDDINDNPDYAYDDNGNMISDVNKGISNITYNHLNLPVQITFPNGIIKYLYNAAGQKLAKTVTEGTVITSTDYLSRFQYKNTKLQFFPHGEGFVNATEMMVFGGGSSYSFNYVFNFTDHLGNIRLSYSKDPVTNDLKIIEENHYYPFGLKHKGYNSDELIYARVNDGITMRPIPPLVESSYKYKYNGKELQEELGLNMYDYGARNYDPAIGRWMNIDPLAEVSRRWSPYTYCYNSPLVFVDPDGMFAAPPIDLYNQDGKKIGTDGTNVKGRMLVTDGDESETIRKTKGNIDLSGVKSGVMLEDDSVLVESLDVLARTEKNGGLSEESSLVMNDESVIRGKTGKKVDLENNSYAGAELPPLPAGKTTSDVKASVHSHVLGSKLNKQKDGARYMTNEPSIGAGKDSETFSQYQTNVIVGRIEPPKVRQTVDSKGQTDFDLSNGRTGITVYKGGGTNPSYTLTAKAIEKILKN